MSKKPKKCKGFLLVLLSFGVLAVPRTVDIPPDVAKGFFGHNTYDVGTYLNRVVPNSYTTTRTSVIAQFPDGYTATYTYQAVFSTIRWLFVPGTGKDPDGNEVKCRECIKPPVVGGPGAGSGEGSLGNRDGNSRPRSGSRTVMLAYTDCYFTSSGSMKCEAKRQIVRY